ncbi:MAG: BrnT family toxin [Nitrospira sp.]|nr:BrnT family toxin [Nitrospira sp.]
MDDLAQVEGFDWDEGNLRKNWERHHVTPWECEQVFFNRPLVVADDKTHSTQEARYYGLGQTDGERLLFLVFTVRGSRIRIISARDMSRKERSRYHEQAQKETEIQE